MGSLSLHCPGNHSRQQKLPSSQSGVCFFRCVLLHVHLLGVLCSQARLVQKSWRSVSSSDRVRSGTYGEERDDEIINYMYPCVAQRLMQK